MISAFTESGPTPLPSATSPSTGSPTSAAPSTLRPLGGMWQFSETFYTQSRYAALVGFLNYFEVSLSCQVIFNFAHQAFKFLPSFFFTFLNYLDQHSTNKREAIDLYACVYVAQVVDYRDLIRKDCNWVFHIHEISSYSVIVRARTDVSTTWADVIFRVNCQSGPLKVIG